MGCSGSSAREPSDDGPPGIYSSGCLSDKYKVTSQVLGQGTFGVVKVCLRRTPEANVPSECAVKTVQLFRESAFGARVGLADLESLETEISVMRSMGTHPNILELFDAYRTASQVQIVLEYARGGTLLDRLSADHGFSELKAASAIRQLAEALAHLHAHSICHRDVKLNNVMLADNDTFVLKLLDFGNAYVGTKTADGRIVMNEPVGTVVYMAPELLVLSLATSTATEWAPVDPELGYDQSVDVFALGMSMYKLVSGQWPLFRELPGPRQRELMLVKMEQHPIEACLATPCWTALSDQCKHLVKAMLAISPADRISPAQILSHPWISGGQAPSVPLTVALEGLKELHLAQLQKLVLRLMEPRLALGCELAPLERLFEEVDLKHDGLISRDELSKVLSALDSHGSYGARLASVFDSLDLKGDGVVSLPEFRASALALDRDLVKKLLRPVFQQMNASGTKELDASDIVRALSSIRGDGEPLVTEAQAQALLDEFDVTRSGKLGIDEFELMMMSDRRNVVEGPRE